MKALHYLRSIVLTDQELEVLAERAVRLSATGNPEQNSANENLRMALDAELKKRKMKLFSLNNGAIVRVDAQ